LTVLAQFVGLDASLESAMAAPRIHTDGNLDLTVDATTSEADGEFLKSIGYRVKQGFVANANALLFNPARASPEPPGADQGHPAGRHQRKRHLRR
jgi:hypothetical protein